MSSTAMDARRAKPTLVLGSTGKTGRRLTERMRWEGLPIREGSRSAAPAFDWEDEAGWPAALDGAGAVYVSYYPDLAAPGAAEKIERLTSLAVAKDARRLVLLSGRGEEEAQACERIVQGSGADWTILRCSWFAQNFSESYMLEGVLDGLVALPAGEVREPFVDCDDIADAAFATLTGEGHEGKLYELTGPRAMTFAEAVGEIAGALGRPIAFVEVPLEGYAAEMQAQGVPQEVIDLVVYLFGTVLDGRNSAVRGGVEQALKRPARDFRDFAKAAAASGVWNARAQPAA